MTGDLALATEILAAACGGRLRIDLPMAPLTTFRIGGPAALYLEPEDERDLAAAAEAIVRAHLPYTVLGKGSNVLVADEGFPGLVLRLGKGFRWSAREGTVLTAGGAMPLPALAGIALHHALAGFAFAIAIPASLGGAVRMNAGAHGSTMSDVVETVDVFHLTGAGRATIHGGDAGFAYRHSALPPDAVVIGARLALAAGEPEEIRARMDEARRWRRETQPPDRPQISLLPCPARSSSGSVRTNRRGCNSR